MNIAILTDTYIPQINGVSTSIQTFAEEFEKLGHSVLIIGPKTEQEEPSDDKVWRFRSMPFPFQKEYRIILPLSRKLKHFKHEQIDIIHGQTPFTMGYLSRYLAYRHKLPLIHTYHTYFEKYLHYLPLPSDIATSYAKSESRRFYNRCDHIVVPSSQMKDALLDYQIQTAIDVVPTGVKLGQHPSDAEKDMFLKTHGLNPNTPKAIFVGRLGQEKNVYFLLDAFAQIHNAHPDLELLIIGDGPERASMVAKARALGVQDKVIFTGYIPHHDIFTAYAVSRIILYPSMTETQGLSLLEGLSMGVPAVCINAMGVADILAGNKGGFLTQDSITDFVAHATQLLSVPDIQQAKATESLARAKDFSAENMAKKMIAVYEHTITTFKEQAPTKRNRWRVIKTITKKTRAKRNKTGQA